MSLSVHEQVRCMIVGMSVILSVSNIPCCSLQYWLYSVIKITWFWRSFCCLVMTCLLWCRFLSSTTKPNGQCNCIHDLCLYCWLPLHCCQIDFEWTKWNTPFKKMPSKNSALMAVGSNPETSKFKPVHSIIVIWCDLFVYWHYQSLLVVWNMRCDWRLLCFAH